MYSHSSVITDFSLMDRKIGKGSVNGSSFFVYTERGKDSKEYIIVNSTDLEGSFEYTSVDSKH